MIWQNELCAVCTCVILCVMAACLTAYACVKLRAEADVRKAEVAFGAEEADGE